MASNTSHAASIRNKHTVGSDLWSSAQNERSSGDLRASNRQLIPYGCCRLQITIRVFIACEEAISDGILTLMWRKKPYFLSAWWITTCSLIHSGSQQIMADFRQTLPVNTLVTQRRTFALRIYDSFLAIFCNSTCPQALRGKRGDDAAGERIVLRWKVKPPMTEEPMHQSVNVSSFLPLIKIKCFFFFPRRPNYILQPNEKAIYFLMSLSKQCGNGHAMGRLCWDGMFTVNCKILCGCKIQSFQ